MKKGEIKKQEILTTAETMFCRKGFSATSVQDILDALHTSKGSFYHHFESKESLLEEICTRRAAASSEQARENIPENETSLRRLNDLLFGMIPLNGEKLTFILMLLPVFRLTEGIQVRERYCRELSRCFAPMIEEVLTAGNLDGSFACPDPEFSSRIMTGLVNDFWCRICEIIIKNEESGILTDPGELLHLSDQYRLTAERILYAPYGSITLIRLPDCQSLAEKIHLHWKSERL